MSKNTFMELLKKIWESNTRLILVLVVFFIIVLLSESKLEITLTLANLAILVYLIKA